MSHTNTSGTSGNETPFRYTADLAGEIERKWQREWATRGTFVVANPGQPGFEAHKPKFYCLDMFPYPSGAGLHVGHPEGYTATDIISRYKRMKGFNVLHPMGWDAFGLPAEQYAIQTGVHPAITTKKAIDNFRRQLQRFGFSYDWTREVGTIDPEYYKWTQWIFLKLYDSWFDPETRKARPIAELVERERRGGSWAAMSEAERRAFVDRHRLAYLAETTVNWCPKLGTVLANDEVIDGKSERGGYPVYRKPMKQWMFRITAYADRLLEGLKGLDWPASTKAMQEEWIGRSEGAEIRFELTGGFDPLTVFTTRADTLFGATYMVVAPEHPLVSRVLDRPPAGTVVPAVRAYVERARNRSDVERMESKVKSGVFSGVMAINPATGEKIPVWIADYVLMGYGTGAIMAVPAHDERDYEFAKKFGLAIRDVVYSRPHAAMAYFARHASPSARSPERWVGVLADYLGWVTTQNTETGGLGGALQTVMTRRAGESGGTAVTIHATAPDPDKPGSVGERRGATQIGWMDFIEEQKFTDVDDFTARFLGGRFFESLEQAYSGPGVLANSANSELTLDGLTIEAAKSAMVAWLERKGIGRKRVNFKLRDWTFSRQRYWGEPFPMVFDMEGRAYPVSEKALPVTLPELADYAPVESEDPLPLLGKVREWVETTAGEAGVDPAVLPPETPVRRESNTMPGSAGSSWYMVRYCDPRNDGAFVSREADRYWMGGERSGSENRAARGGVDLYMGGSEHAVGHLLYSRFWHQVLHDLGYLSTSEPFQKLFHQGLITSFAYQRPDKTLVPCDQVDEVSEGQFVERGVGTKLTPIVAKMSKSLKNVVNPDDVIAEYGADTFRLYEMYMGPLEASKPWNPRDITGLFRFLSRVWRLAVDEKTGVLREAVTADAALEKQLHRVVAKVGSDIEKLSFNTAIAAMIEFVNAASSQGLTRDQLARFMRVLCPFAPHVAEEVWSKLGCPGLASTADWPAFDPAMLRDDSVELAVQIQGKVRCKVVVPSDAEPKAIEEITLADSEVQKALGGKAVKKVIVVPGRLVNIVAG